MTNSACTLAYDIVGPEDAPAVVLLPSLGATRRMWDWQTKDLADRFRIITVDLRGHGESPAPAEEYSIAELAEDVLALIDDLGIERVNITGISLGGAVAQFFAQAYPERTETLTAISTTTRFGQRRDWLDKAELVTEEGTQALADSVVARWFTPTWAQRNPEIVQDFYNAIVETSDSGYAGCCHALAHFDSSAYLARVNAPTLVIAGQTDPSTPLEAVNRVRSGIVGSRMVTIDPAAHLVTVQQADLVNSLLAGFWR